MSSYKFTGKTVREAIDKACQELKMDEALLDVKVIQESTRGFLGIVGQRDALVSVRKRDILKEVMEAERPSSSAQQAEEPPTVRKHDNQESASSAASPQTEERRGTEHSEESPVMSQAKGVLEGILERMSMETEVNSEMMDQAVYLDIKGTCSGLLIGKQGQTLDALQFLVNKIVNRQRPHGSKIEIIVDTEKYRLRKREQFREKTLKKSRQAKKTNKPVSFPPMPPYERRLVHMILADDREVYTKSVGEGHRRQVIVYPRRAMPSKRRRR